MVAAGAVAAEHARQLAVQGGDGGGAAVAQLGAERPQMTGPARVGDEFQCRLLERPGHEEAVHHLGGPQPGQGRAARGEGTDPQVGRGGLGERTQVHHHPVAVVGGERPGQGGGVRVHQQPGEVVLDDEGPGRAGDPEHLGPALGGEHRAGRVLEQRLADEDPRPGGLEGVRQQVGADAVGVDRHRDGPQSGRPDHRQDARVGR